MTSTKASSPVPAVTPLKPRRSLLFLTSVIFAVWVAAMIVMYVTTVYPQRHSKNASAPSTAEVR